MTNNEILKGTLSRLHNIGNALASLNEKISNDGGSTMPGEEIKETTVATEVTTVPAVEVAPAAPAAEVTPVAPVAEAAASDKKEEVKEEEKKEGAKATDAPTGEVSSEAAKTETVAPVTVMEETTKASEEKKEEAAATFTTDVNTNVDPAPVEPVVNSTQLKAAFSSEQLKSFGFSFSEAEAALAEKFSFEEAIKLVASLSKEVANYKKIEAEAKAMVLAEARMKELNDAGLSFVEGKADIIKNKVKSLNDEAFASYKEEMLSLAQAITPKDVIAKDEIAQARETLGKASMTVVDEETRASKMKHIR